MKRIATLLMLLACICLTAGNKAAIVLDGAQLVLDGAVVAFEPPVPLDPPDPADTLMWIDFADSDQISFGIGDYVSGIADKATAGTFDFTQPSASARPQLSGTLNGYTTCVFDGVDDMLTWTGDANDKSYRIMLVAKPLAVGDNVNESLFSMYSGEYGDNSDWQFQANSTTEFQGLFNSTVPDMPFTDPPSAITGWHTFEVLSDKTVGAYKRESYLDGTLVYGYYDVFGEFDKTDIIIRIGSNRNGLQCMQCEIAEIILLPVGEDPTQTRTYLNAKWGL